MAKLQTGQHPGNGADPEVVGGDRRPIGPFNVTPTRGTPELFFAKHQASFWAVGGESFDRAAATDLKRGLNGLTNILDT